MGGAGGAGSFAGVSGGRAVGRRPPLAPAPRRCARRGRPSPSGSGCPRLSAGCWRSAASISTTRPGFLAPRLRDQLPDPSHLLDMDAAVARLVRAVREGRNDRVFGDYDVDGATSAALLTRFFAAVGARSRIYVPDRLREGYGPERPSAAQALRARASQRRRHRRLRHDRPSAARRSRRSAGLDVIVIDHHVAEPLLPRAVAVVNPNRLDEASPHGCLGGGRRRLSAGGRGQPRAARRRLVRGAPGRARSARNGSIWWRSARCAMSCR